jgi:K+ transporter
MKMCWSAFLVFWSLVIIVTLKYHVYVSKQTIAAKEFALMALVHSPPERGKVLPAEVLSGSPVETNADSGDFSLSAVEGLEIATRFSVRMWYRSRFDLIGLFLFQRRRSRCRAIFDPSSHWFLTLAILGLINISTTSCSGRLNPAFAFISSTKRFS